MNIEWDYGYYQPWSDNKWLVDEMLALLDKDCKGLLGDNPGHARC